jgi:hypothetical protein
VSTACGRVGGGGRGRLYADRGFAPLDAYEYVGEEGIGGNCESVGEEGRDIVRSCAGM